MEGGIGFGLGAILKSQITLDKGRIVEGNFDSYDVLRIDEMPSVEVHIVKSSAPPTGVGEPGVPPSDPRWPTRCLMQQVSAFCRLQIRKTAERGERSFVACYAGRLPIASAALIERFAGASDEPTRFARPR
jgi:hypothetical protein